MQSHLLDLPDPSRSHHLDIPFVLLTHTTYLHRIPMRMVSKKQEVLMEELEEEGSVDIDGWVVMVFSQLKN